MFSKPTHSQLFNIGSSVHALNWLHTDSIWTDLARNSLTAGLAARLHRLVGNADTLETERSTDALLSAKLKTPVRLELSAAKIGWNIKHRFTNKLLRYNTS